MVKCPSCDHEFMESTRTTRYCPLCGYVEKVTGVQTWEIHDEGKKKGWVSSCMASDKLPGTNEIRHGES